MCFDKKNTGLGQGRKIERESEIGREIIGDRKGLKESMRRTVSYNHREIFVHRENTSKYSLQ